MTAKHRNHAPKRQRRPDDLEKRIRRIERNYVRDITKIATHVARIEIELHEQAKHGAEYFEIGSDDNGWHRIAVHALGSDSYTEESG
ncbi:MAG: hypothetical protein ACHQC8_07760 [Solirubrobacterales bacterium]